MGRWRTNVLYSLILFSAGFATAIYVLAPPSAEDPDGIATVTWSKGTTEVPGPSAQDRAAQMRAGMDNVVSFAEENAVKVFRVAKLQLDQWRRENGH